MHILALIAFVLLFVANLAFVSALPVINSDSHLSSESPASDLPRSVDAMDAVVEIPTSVLDQSAVVVERTAGGKLWKHHAHLQVYDDVDDADDAD